ncbi:Threonine--tRNA ligase [Anatilimnocola aggregata]|uniref:Threonine--tRNA ligase n=1 Tax=Anatilimnocola aggregata TaxID=2528021 RepID=A0A517YIH0_9BACT|nr:threonine--tRNA ligase [Anatilimnocola aggregata]QDU30012.1 Threonine--tRNA ligase [Anatilimnocola aggregata]
MLKVSLPDGSVKEFPASTTPRAIAESIGPRLAKATLAAEVDGKVVGSDYVLPSEGEVKLRLLTRKDAEALAVMRHSCAHIMARAVMRLKKGVQLAFGPTVEGGFYYDFQLPEPLTDDDFPAIEAEMKKIIALDEGFERIEVPREKALAIVQGLDQKYKVEHIETGLATHPELSFYRQGEFIDLCRGPHIPSASAVGAFKLLSLAGAYWKGDSDNAQLQRLYATAFFTQEELDEHLKKIEEAKRRDHRVLGKQLQLFTLSNDVGPGLCLWLPKGAMIRSQLEEFIKQELTQRAYLPVYTPHIGRIQMYQTSGHFPYYMESQFPPFYFDPFMQSVQQLFALQFQGKLADNRFIGHFEEALKVNIDGLVPISFGGFGNAKTDADKMHAIKEWFDEQEAYLLKPMNCPHHIQIYKAQKRSYKELPLRLAEFGSVYRFEKTGQLNGMTRVRGFTQDDAHLFCMEDQVPAEFEGCIAMTQFVLKSLGLDNYRVRLGFRDPKSDKYVGSEQVWNRAQNALEDVCTRLGIAYTAEPGEAAFYGPKADFVVTDCIGREWQLGTVQLDYNLPARFGLEYTASDNKAHQPVMIHRAPLGSMERFIGVLIEHFAGAFPLWLAPEQVRVITVSEKSEEYGRKIEQQLRIRGLRVTGDFRPEKLGAKIRDGQLELIPYMLVVGPRDAEQGTVSVRDRLEGDLGAMSLDAAIAHLQAEIAERRVRKTYSGSAGLVEKEKTNEY